MTSNGSPNHAPALDPTASALWDKLRRFRFDRGTGPRTFAVRLASEQGWSASFTTLAIGEYRRFLLLFALDKTQRADGVAGADEPAPVRIVPSEVVDKVWHLHLLYTQSYWETLCRDILGGPLHHLPADGSTGEAPVLDTVYANTLDAYRRTFGHAAPESVWPAPTPPGLPGNAHVLDRMYSRGMTTGSLVVMGGLFFFAMILRFQGMIAPGILFLAVIGVAVAMAGADSRLSANPRRGSRRRAMHGTGWSGGDADGGFPVGSGSSSGDYGAPAHHDSSHDAGGHAHSCGGGHSCSGHGCGGHGCGGSGCGGH